jgi:hypothetical protein
MAGGTQMLSPANIRTRTSDFVLVFYRPQLTARWKHS